MKIITKAGGGEDKKVHMVESVHNRIVKCGTRGRDGR